MVKELMIDHEGTGETGIYITIFFCKYIDVMVYLTNIVLYLIIGRILVWEDGFCNFAASAGEMSSGECSGGSTAYANSDFQQYQGLQPELFFKMSHEIYNYGEGYVWIINTYKDINNYFSNFYFFHIVLSLFWVSLFWLTGVFDQSSYYFNTYFLTQI